MRMLRLLLISMLLAVPALAQQESLLIGSGDMLDVRFFDTPELEQHLRVTDLGTIPLLFVGDLKVLGLTPSAAAREVERIMVDKHYMLNPQVAVTVEQYATQSVSVLGQVKSPGAFSINTPRKILDLLALAGGLTDVADRRITIQRHSNAAIRVDYCFSNHSTDALNDQVMVYPGDTVLVPKAGIVYVLGDVGRPGGYPITSNDSRMTVLQAIALAAGTNKTAAMSEAKLLRKSTSGYQSSPLKVSGMQKGKVPDVVLQPDDIIYVSSSHLKNIVMSSSIVASTLSATIYHF